MKQDIIWDYHQNRNPQVFDGTLHRISFLAKLLKKGERVLNIGVGSGFFEEIALGAGLDVYALDPSAESINTIREKHHLSDKAKTGYIQEIPFAGDYFDAVVVSEVFEHLTDDVLQKALQEIKRILKPGGRIIGTVPACENLHYQTCVCPSCGTVFHRWGHVRSFTPRDAEKLLGPYFRMITIKQTIFVPWNVLNWKGKIEGIIKTLLNRAGIHGADATLVFVGRKTG